MIIGSGLVARAFLAHAPQLASACIYAAGVSNSSCVDPREFARERQRLESALDTSEDANPFVYFSTCSTGDPDLLASAYVDHKLRMEELVRAHPRYLVLRLPQLAGHTPNPHTLLNYLHARIVRSERFAIWSRAQRNIIDVDDMARVALDLILTECAAGETINVAAPRSATIGEIVVAMEQVLGRHAIYDSIDRGSAYLIDILRIRPSLHRLGLSFPPGYLHDVITKYYARHA